MNRTLLVGRLTADPELRTTPNGIATTRITVAVDRIPGPNGERVADFINVVVWRRQAENVAKYCTKGSLVGVDGRIQTRNYEAQDGTRRYVTEVVADNIRFLGSRSSNAEGGNIPAQTSAAQEEDVPFPEGEPMTGEATHETADVSEDPFKDFGSEVVLSDDDLPF